MSSHAPIAPPVWRGMQAHGGPDSVRARFAYGIDVVAIRRLLIAGLVGALLATIAGVVLALSAPIPSPRQATRTDAREVLGMLTSANTCAGGCSVSLLGQASRSTWRVAINTPLWRRCFLISPGSFGTIEGHGWMGIDSTPCN
jgi:hypothetical protein